MDLNLTEAKRSRKKRAAKKGKKVLGGYLTITTGDPWLNDERFNTAMGTADINDAADSIGDALAGESNGLSGDGGGEAMGESLILAEGRTVKRYYIRPQNIYCANKEEILKALIKLGDANCSVYTLNNLEDNKDTHLLSSSDIIYYYDDGILYDKNKVRIMDYDLSVRKEEQRKRFTGSDLNMDRPEVKAEYKDRLVDAEPETEIEESLNPFSLEFDAVNAFGETLTEGHTHTCCICGEELTGYGNNPSPVAEDGKCCDSCNLHFVLPARIAKAADANDQQK